MSDPDHIDESPAGSDFVVSIEDGTPPRVRVGVLERQPLPAPLSLSAGIDLLAAGRDFRAAMVARARARLTREVGSAAKHGSPGEAPTALPPEELGRALFDAILGKRELFTLYNEWRNNPSHGRLRFRIDPKWVSLPWELARHEPSGAGEPARAGVFLGTDEATPLVREVATNEGFPPPVTLGEEGLSVLAFGANPISLPGLQVDREEQLLRKALEGAGRLDWRSGGEADLADALLEKGGTAHQVFHFAGHGSFDGGEGYIYLGPDGKAIPAERLASALRRCKSLRLVVLNACEGAAAGSDANSASIAARLVERGIPAVLAMQAPILDDTALEVVQSLYRSLARGRPIERAVNDLRLRLLSMGLEWAAPVLTMGSPGTPLFIKRRPPVQAVQPPVSQPPVTPPVPPPPPPPPPYVAIAATATAAVAIAIVVALGSSTGSGSSASSTTGETTTSTTGETSTSTQTTTSTETPSEEDTTTSTTTTTSVKTGTVPKKICIDRNSRTEKPCATCPSCTLYKTDPLTMSCVCNQP